MRKRQQKRDQGQILILVALMVTVIFGVTALAVDIGVLIDHKRVVTNASDAAALAAARDLNLTTSGVSLANQKAAAADAACSLALDMNWPTNWAVGGSATTQCVTGGTPSPVPASTCSRVGGSASAYCFSATFGNYSVTFSTPPLDPTNPADQITTDAEVSITSTNANSFATIWGTNASSVKAKSVAYHSGPLGPSTWGFYVQGDVQSGNQQESVTGSDAYIGGSYLPQSNGKAGLCVYDAGGVGGHIVFGSTTNGNSVTYNSPGACPGHGQLTSSLAPNLCPLLPDIRWNFAVSECVATPPVGLPVVDKPANTSGPASTSICSGSPPRATITTATPGGVYEIGAGCVATIQYPNGGGTLNCISLILDNGTSAAPTTIQYSVQMNTTDTWPSYGSSSGGGCGGGTTVQNTRNNTLLWADPTSSNVLFTNGSTGNCKCLLPFTGTIYMPAGTVFLGQNESNVELTGQVIVNSWNVQSGNHGNPQVIFNNADVPDVNEILRLVE